MEMSDCMDAYRPSKALSGNECDEVIPFRGIAGVRDDREKRDDCRICALHARDEDPRRMMTGPKVVKEVSKHRALVAGDQHPGLPFCPQKDFRTRSCEGQVAGITHANCVDRMRSPSVVRLDGVPQGTSKVLVEHEPNGHASRFPTSPGLLLHQPSDPEDGRSGLISGFLSL